MSNGRFPLLCMMTLFLLSACTGSSEPPIQQVTADSSASSPGHTVQSVSPASSAADDATDTEEPILQESAPLPTYEYMEEVVLDMTEEQQYYYDAYVSKFLLTGMLALNWSSEDYHYLSTAPDSVSMSNNLMFAFEDLMGREAMSAVWEEHGIDIPAAIVEEILVKYFPFTTEELHEILVTSYDADSQTYHYSGGRGGGPITGRVVDVSKSGEYVKVAYDLYFGDIEALKYSGILTLKEASDGHFIYWSVETDDIDPNMKRDVYLRDS